MESLYFQSKIVKCVSDKHFLGGKKNQEIGLIHKYYGLHASSLLFSGLISPLNIEWDGDTIIRGILVCV